MSKSNPAKKPKSDEPVPIPRENPFVAISRMFKSSIGRLPGHLVIIFCGSLVLTILCGFLLEFAQYEARQGDVYLPERLKAQEDKPALTEAQLQGIWVYSAEKYIVTLKIGSGVFELISRYTSEPFSRYFVRGGYKTVGNVLVLQERKDLGTPIDPAHLEYKFYPMTMPSINLYAQTDGRVMLWQTPGREQRRLDNPERELQMIFSDSVSWIKISDRP